jgi:hypothetical protein
MSDELNNLAAEAAAVDAATAPPEITPPGEQVFIPAADQLAGAKVDAALLIGGASALIEKKWGVGVSPQTRDKGAEKLAPLMLKYDLDSPWLRKWRIEIEAAMFVGGTAYAIYQAVQARKNMPEDASQPAPVPGA